jgi:hypothetical protein
LERLWKASCNSGPAAGLSLGLQVAGRLNRPRQTQLDYELQTVRLSRHYLLIATFWWHYCGPGPDMTRYPMIVQVKSNSGSKLTLQAGTQLDHSNRGLNRFLDAASVMIVLDSDYKDATD